MSMCACVYECVCVSICVCMCVCVWGGGGGGGQSKKDNYVCIQLSFHWPICHILFQFNLLTPQCIYLLILWDCLLLFLCTWCWLRVMSLCIPPANADSDQCTTHSPSNECHQQAENCCNGNCGCCRQTFV